MSTSAPHRAVVTGAARGLGAAVAGRLAADGWRVLLTDVSPDVEATAAELSGCASAVGDVSDEAFADAAIAAAVEAFGGVDALVNNAGIGGPGTHVVDTDLAEFRRVLEVNLVGAFLMARAGGRRMIAQGTGGAIVNLGSIIGQQGVPGDAGYGASKAAIANLTQVLALELGPHGIRVNTVAPGNMDTAMHLEYLEYLARAEGISADEARERVRRTIPLGRHGTGGDIAGAVAWLLSPDASYVTGQTIGVNGGVFLT